MALIDKRATPSMAKSNLMGDRVDGNTDNNNGGDEIAEQGGCNNPFLRLPYGIAKSRGLDTTGMTPRQVWDMLAGKGISPKGEMNKLASKLEQDKNSLTKDKTSDIISSKGTVAERLKVAGVIYNPDPNYFSSPYNGTNKELIDANMEQLANLIDKYPLLGKLTVQADKLNNKYATHSNGGVVFELAKQGKIAESFGGVITLDRASYKTHDGIWHNYSSDTKLGHSGKCDKDKEKLYTITHEYGHQVASIMRIRAIANDTNIQNNIANLLRPTRQSRSAIQNKLRTQLNYADSVLVNKVLAEYKSMGHNISQKGSNAYQAVSVSDYGKTNKAEFLAECFAELNCSSSPRPICKALETVLKKEGLSK